MLENVTFSKNENQSETCSAVYSLFTADHLTHFLHSITERKYTQFGQDDKVHKLNIEQQKDKENGF